MSLRQKQKHFNYKRAAIILGLIFWTVILALLILQAGFYFADKNIKCWLPDYDKINILPILDKTELTANDYKILYNQTGLTEIGINRAIAKGEEGVKRVAAIQDSFFCNHEVKHDHFAPWLCTDYIKDNAINIYLEEGDIVVTSSAHLSFIRIGHAGLVIDGEHENVLQARSYGALSSASNIKDFTGTVNFMILRPKADAETINKVTEYAKNNLNGVPYNLFNFNEELKTTQCAHLVWYAYHKFGIELVKNKNVIVFPFDLARSANVELVQVFGFNPNQLWTGLF